MDKVRLNNFILWCKGWYCSVSTKRNIITEARKILTLDGYLSNNNPISIALCYIDELVNKEVIKPIRLLTWHVETIRYMSLYNVDYNEALLHIIKNFFAFECDKLSLTPPIYSRKLYKLGFIAPTYFGNSYKCANYKIRKFFNNL